MGVVVWLQTAGCWQLTRKSLHVLKVALYKVKSFSVIKNFINTAWSLSPFPGFL